MCECEKKPDGVNAQITRTGKVRGGGVWGWGWCLEPQLSCFCFLVFSQGECVCVLHV